MCLFLLTKDVMATASSIRKPHRHSRRGDTSAALESTGAVLFRSLPGQVFRRERRLRSPGWCLRGLPRGHHLGIELSSILTPDLNPIEQVFAKFKHLLHNKERARIGEVMRTAVGKASKSSRQRNALTTSRTQDTVQAITPAPRVAILLSAAKGRLVPTADLIRALAVLMTLCRFCDKGEIR
jgi:hypothetical protein